MAAPKMGYAMKYLGINVKHLVTEVPTLARFGVAAGVAGVYFTDNWIGHNLLRYIPVLGESQYGWSFTEEAERNAVIAKELAEKKAALAAM
eukprot:m.28803 g.28803  ORF g.28803 m.28803 type:complete len:91 (-) comp15987_c0_seq1:260-532(-)